MAEQQETVIGQPSASLTVDLGLPSANDGPLSLTDLLNARMQPAQTPSQEPANVWMKAVEAPPDCPKGLEFLTALDMIVIKQKSHIPELILSFRCANKYRILNKEGHQCYYALEKSHPMCVKCCGANREFTMIIANGNKEPVFTISRPYKYFAGYNWCACLRCAQDEIEVADMDGNAYGYVREAWSCLRPHYLILDHNQDPQFEIWGPVCPCTACNPEVEFMVKSIDSDEVVAKISKMFSASANDFFSSVDNFGIYLPLDMDVKMKATLMGCVFLIDFMFFEYVNDHKRIWDSKH